MSDYFKCLDVVAKDRYSKKLAMLGLRDKDDPYVLPNNQNFVDNMALWPPVEYSNIFCYFIEQCTPSKN